MSMQAIEFQSVVEDDIIHIPEPYKGKITSPVTVMIFAEVLHDIFLQLLPVAYF
jgi:hypothetical protein